MSILKWEEPKEWRRVRLDGRVGVIGRGVKVVCGGAVAISRAVGVAATGGIALTDAVGLGLSFGGSRRNGVAAGVIATVGRGFESTSLERFVSAAPAESNSALPPVKRQRMWAQT
jgi:hypothetical protein